MIKWDRANEVQTRQLLKKFDLILFNISSVACPVCDSNTIRFYFHEWDAETEGTASRGVVWIWCTTCQMWTSKGNIGLLESTGYVDPFKGMPLEEFGCFEEAIDWPSNLNILWERGKLPKSAVHK